MNQPFFNVKKQLAAVAEYKCAWSREEALQAMSGAIGVAIQLGNALALDAVPCKNRRRGLTAAARVPAPAPVIEEEQLLVGEDSDHDQYSRFPVDHPLSGVHSDRVIIPQSDSQSQSQSLSHNNNIDRDRGNCNGHGNGGAHLADDGSAG